MATDLDARLDALDPALLAAIPSQTTDFDRAGLLALHVACRRVLGEFRWLEIGSHLGGSLQALVQDPACVRIDSIDPRPPAQDDERGERYAYPANSTQRMLELLGALPDADLAKLHTHDVPVTALDPEALPQPAVCFVDGEHTDRAATADADFCRRVLRDEGLIVFHDAGIVYRAIRRFVDRVRGEGLSVQLAYLPDSLFCVELGPPRLLGEETVVRQRLEAHWGALWLLHSNDRFRTALEGRLPRLLRRARVLDVPE
jgi:hypothetical protein